MFFKKIKNLSSKQKLLIIIVFLSFNLIFGIAGEYYLLPFTEKALPIPEDVRIGGLIMSIYFTVILPIIFLLLPFLLFGKTPKESLSYIGFKGRLWSYVALPFILFGIYVLLNLLFQKVFHLVPSRFFYQPYSFELTGSISWVPFSEEIFFRAILIRLGLDAFYRKDVWKINARPVLFVLLMSSAFFAIGHLPISSSGVTTDIFSFFSSTKALGTFDMFFSIGVVFGFIYLKFKNIKYLILAHYLFNLTLVLVGIYL